MSTWREQYARSTLDAALTGSFSRCASANDTEFATWRKERAVNARLLSICAHGTAASIAGCKGADIYLKSRASQYPEVRGAIIHLVACEALRELAGALVKEGGASAAIGYDEVFTAWVPAGEEPTHTSTALPEAIQSALACDTEILLALATGASVADAVARAKDWANVELKKLDGALAQPGLPEETRIALVWRRANLLNNVDHLDFEGVAEATVMKAGV